MFIQTRQIIPNKPIFRSWKTTRIHQIKSEIQAEHETNQNNNPLTQLISDIDKIPEHEKAYIQASNCCVQYWNQPLMEVILKLAETDKVHQIEHVLSLIMGLYKEFKKAKESPQRQKLKEQINDKSIRLLHDLTKKNSQNCANPEHDELLLISDDTWLSILSPGITQTLKPILQILL